MARGRGSRYQPWCSILGPTWWTERTNSCKLSSDLHTCTVVRGCPSSRNPHTSKHFFSKVIWRPCFRVSSRKKYWKPKWSQFTGKFYVTLEIIWLWGIKVEDTTVSISPTGLFQTSMVINFFFFSHFPLFLKKGGGGSLKDRDYSYQARLHSLNRSGLATDLRNSHT